MRKEGWENRLTEVVLANYEKPFEWGKADCASFPMEVVKALTGKFPKSYDHRYTSAKQAAAVLKKLKVKNLEEAFAKEFEEVAPAFAQRGDIGIADYPGAQLGGGVVVIGEHILAKTEEGLVRLPRSFLRRAFRVE